MAAAGERGPARRELLLGRLLPAVLAGAAAAPGAAGAEQIGAGSADSYRVFRPTGQDLPTLYSFQLPLVAGKRWGAYGDLDNKVSSDAMFKVAFVKGAPKSVVLGRQLPADFLQYVRSYQYPEGTGIVKDTGDGDGRKPVDLEWTDLDQVGGKNFKIHNWAHILRGGAPEKDVLLLFQVPDDQATDLLPLWSAMRDTMRLGS